MVRLQELELVFHQRKQGRNHQGQSAQKLSGKLVAEGFPAACGKNRRRRLAGQQQLHNPALSGKKGGKSEMSGKLFFKVHD